MALNPFNPYYASDDDDDIVMIDRTYEEEECVMCLDAKACIMFPNCRHVVCCKECVDILFKAKANAMICPYCRVPLQVPM